MSHGEHWPRDIKGSAPDPQGLIDSFYRETLFFRPYLQGPTAVHCDNLMASLEAMGATSYFEKD